MRKGSAQHVGRLLSEASLGQLHLVAMIQEAELQLQVCTDLLPSGL